MPLSSAMKFVCQGVVSVWLASCFAGCSGAPHDGGAEPTAALTEALVVALPARIEAENYERYNETTPATNSGGACNRGDGVDKENTTDPTGGSCNIGWTAPGEWLEYDVTSPNLASYNLVLRVASGAANTSLHALIDGVSLGTVAASTGGWQTWQDRTYSNLALSAGSHVLRVYFDTQDVNLNYLRFDLVASCTDGLKNGSETSVDCGGGSCATCANGQACAVDADCASERCNSGVCRAGLPFWVFYCTGASCGEPVVTRLCPDSNPNCSPTQQSTIIPEVDGQQLNQIFLPVQPPDGYSLFAESGSANVGANYAFAFGSPVVVRSDVPFTVTAYNAPVTLGGTMHLNFTSEAFSSANLVTTVLRYPTFLTNGEPTEMDARARNIVAQESAITSIFPGLVHASFAPSEFATLGDGNFSDGVGHVAINYSNPGWIAYIGDVYTVALPELAHEYTHQLFAEVAGNYPGNSNLCINEGLADALPYAAGFMPEANFGPIGQQSHDFNQGCVGLTEVHEAGNCPLWQVKRLSSLTTAFVNALLHPQHVISFDTCNLADPRTGNAYIVLFSDAAGTDLTQAVQMAGIPNAGSYAAARAALGI